MNEVIQRIFVLDPHLRITLQLSIAIVALEVLTLTREQLFNANLAIRAVAQAALRHCIPPVHKKPVPMIAHARSDVGGDNGDGCRQSDQNTVAQAIAEALRDIDAVRNLDDNVLDINGPSGWAHALWARSRRSWCTVAPSQSNLYMNLPYSQYLATVPGQHGLRMPFHIVVVYQTLLPPNQNDPQAIKMSSARRTTRQAGLSAPNTSGGPGRQPPPATRGRGAPRQNQQLHQGQGPPSRVRGPVAGYGGYGSPMAQGFPYDHRSPPPPPPQLNYAQQNVWDAQMQNFAEQYEEYGEYDDEDFTEDVMPRGGPNNDQWPQSVFEPNNAANHPEELVSSLHDPAPPQGNSPDDAPLRRLTRGAEPAITNTEFRDLIPSTGQRVETVAVTLPTTPVRRAEPSNTRTAYSPYSRVLNPNDKSKPRLYDQSPRSSELAQKAGFRYRKHIIIKSAFPTRDESNKLISQMVADSSVGIEKGEARLKRYKADKSYRVDVDKLVRGLLVKCCRDNSGTAFKLVGLPKAKVITIVLEFLETKSYHFREIKRETEIVNGVEVEKRQGAYRHPLIEFSIRKLCFQDHERMATNDDAGDSFNPIPNEVIALTATAISCALAEWRTGVHLIGKTLFKEVDYKGTYQEHLAALEAMTAEAPDTNLAWRAYLFQRCSTGLLNNEAAGEMPVTLTRTELTDYSDIPEAV
ncbi:hypothetical protein AURDEDRAFT_164666 [Auricularia subglabra TFB-10046 SS5]|nr:hypothetical protein AURDEDRAFT_164666 [Auricularia subglabra TFB-10046 SS5]